MKTPSEVLRDADPLVDEPRRSVQERRTSRQRILEAPRVGHAVGRRPMAVRAVVALAMIVMVFALFQWPRTAADLVAAVRFEVHLAEEQPAPGLRETAIVGTDRKTYLHAEIVVANSDIAQALLVPGNSASTFGVSITFTAAGAAKILRATQSHVGRPVAILVDGEVVAVPVLRSAISTEALISGQFTRAEAERIVGGIVGR